MPHQLSRSRYSSLIDRLNRFPQGAPPSELLYKILALLFTDKEAELVGQLPMHPFTAEKAAHIWKMREVEAARILERLADRALMLDMELNENKLYLLPPPMAGFFEFSLMRTRSDIDQEGLSELFHQYLNLEDTFIRELFTEGKTRVGRILVDEKKIPESSVTRVLDYERASEVIKNAWRIGVGTCYCRHKMQHLGHACSAEMEICMTFDVAADSLIRHGHAKEIDKQECLDLLQLAREQNLVQMGENVREGVSFICNCCGCCCESMVAARKFGNLQPVHTSNFLPELNGQLCSGCGKCIDVCPVEALSLVSANHPRHPTKRKCVIDTNSCLGCGVCARVCPTDALTLKTRESKVITPVDSAHRIVTMAIERGKLQHLIWDNRAVFSHRAVAAVVGVIMKLPTVQQALAQSQLGSRYLDAIIKRHSRRVVASTLRY